MNEEAHIALRVRQALHESASRLEPRLALRLHEARQVKAPRVDRSGGDSHCERRYEHPVLTDGGRSAL